MAGAADAALCLTRDYAVQRVQFGRPIGAFQAVKHPLVDILIGVESARTLALGAAAALDHQPERAELPARMAKAAAGDAFSLAVRKAVQLHGGYGFTWDCDAHFYFKRALWSRATLGDAGQHRRRLADALLGPAE
jgi:alkylation response protein AidB-like acyl-CoA dehydrogenase